MKLTDRDKKLLYIVAGLLLVFCAYFFGFRNLSSKNEDLESELSKKNTVYNNLRVMAMKKADYLEDTEKFNNEYTTLLSRFDSGYSQEYSIMFLKELEDNTGCWLSQVGLAQTQKIYDFGNTVSSNPTGSGNAGYATDYKGYSTTLTLTYQASYDEFKDLINYLNTYKYKCVINSVSSSYNAESDTVSGSLVITQYAITGGDREFYGAYIDNYLNGTDNIFDSPIFTPGTNADIENGGNILKDYDYYMTLDAFGADSDSIAIGKKGDSTGESVLSTNAAKKEDVTISFAGANGNYTVQYKIGSITYPATNYTAGVAFDPGNLLSMLIISSPRMSEDDLNGVSATIVNDTDMTLYVKVVNDDESNPRFTLKEKWGDVVIYE